MIATTYEPCACCGEETRQRDAFGDPLCTPCWEDEDDAIEAYEASQQR